MNVDTLYQEQSALVENFSSLEIDRAGSTRLLFEDGQVSKALERVTKSKVLEMLAAWHLEDNPDLHHAGRPRIIHDAAILVGLLLLFQEFSPLFLRDLAALFQHRLRTAARSMLNLPEPGTSRYDSRKERQRWEKNTNNAFHRTLNDQALSTQTRSPSRTQRWIGSISQPPISVSPRSPNTESTGSASKAEKLERNTSKVACTALAPPSR